MNLIARGQVPGPPEVSFFGLMKPWKSFFAKVFVLQAFLVGTAFAQEPNSLVSSDYEAAFPHAREDWVGDLSGIVERNLLRIGTVYSPIYLVYDGLEQSGITVDTSVELTKHLRETIGESADDLTVLVIPLARNDLVPALVGGRVDLLMANLTITPKRSEHVAFTDPVLTDVHELVVTGPSAAAVSGFDNLVSHGLHVRPSSSYAESLEEMNAKRASNGKETIPAHEADEHLEDHDLLEMVAAGALPAVVVDSHKAELWAQVFQELRIHEDLSLREGGEIALAVRQNSPELLESLNAFVKISKKGTLLGNILFERYYSDKDRIVNALDPEPRAQLSDVFDIIQKHAHDYGFEPLLIAALGFQESRLDQSKKSAAGALGIMQLMPKTAKDPNVDIPEIHLADKNVQAGVKYLRFINDRYFADAEITSEDGVFLSLAAYNAGPRKIANAREEAVAMGLDPNVWFDNVEIAAARVIGREPVVYVRNILKYYSQYRAYSDLAESLGDPK